MEDKDIRYSKRAKLRPQATNVTRLALAASTAGFLLTTTLPLLALSVARADSPQTPPSASPPFPDVPANHWAFDALRSLADKGLIKGYPNGSFLGDRALTRYEFAMVVARLLDTLHASATPPAPNLPPPPAPPGVTQEDLNKVQALVETLRSELTGLRASLDADTKDIATLRSQIAATDAKAQKALDAAGAATVLANASYGVSYGASPPRPFTISGFIETRYERVDSGNRTLFPNGVGSINGYNGNYEQGDSASSFKVREVRLAFSGAVTQNTRYVLEFGTPGGVNTTVTGTPQVFIRRLYGQYTFGDGQVGKNLSLLAGQLWLPFGYMINTGRGIWYTPERPLAFNESGSGLFGGQEFDRGIQASYGPGKAGIKVALINGSGGASNDTNPPKDVIVRATYTAAIPGLDLGLSGYRGRIDTTPDLTSGAKKDFYGADLRYKPTRRFVPYFQFEYVNGIYEAIPPATFGSPTPPAGSTVPQASALVRGNRIEGYYFITGWTFHPASERPFSLIFLDDTFNRSLAQHTRIDRNHGFGAMYNLDRATRFRIFYTKPDAVAHAPGTVSPPKIGLSNAEFLFTF